MRLFYLLFMAFCLCACQSSQRTAQSIDVQASLHDDEFSNYQRYPIESHQQVFSLSEQAKDFVRKSVSGIKDPSAKMESLVRSIFDYSELDLLYFGSANTSASETFAKRAANCLSMSIMTFAMAKEAGFVAKFQNVMIPEYWTRRDGYSLLNGHINIVLSPPERSGVIKLFDTDYEVDFDPQNARKHFPKRFINTHHVMAMFYNNKGADALVNKEYDKAYAYFRAGLLIYPEFDSTWVNLGVLYRTKGLMKPAEKSYLNAIALDQENLTAWENLAFLYQATDNKKQSREILAMVNQRRNDNPYYHFILGEQALDRGRWQLALSHYREALKLDKSKHEIYFGLAKAYYEIGDVSRSQSYLKIAQRKSHNRHDQQRYQGKLNLLGKR